MNEINNEENTMILYRFFNAKYGLDSIEYRRLKISRIMELNDPFEFLGVDLSDKEFRKALQGMKESMSEKAGLLCFSKFWSNPLLWTHYADKHRGICLGFKVPNDVVGKVNYMNYRPGRPEVLDQSFMKELLHTKFSHWEYEQEYRMWTTLKKKINGHPYLNFVDNKLILKRVIVGAESCTTRSEVSEALGNLARSVDVFKSRAAFKSFKVVKNINDSLWV